MLMNSLVCQNQHRLTQDSFQDLIEQNQGIGENYVLTEEVWDRVAGEVVGRMDNFMEELLLVLVQNVLDGDYEQE
jgi:hypothetical protein